MKIYDRVYGEFEITEPVLIELINSKPVQRLKKIDQMGPPFLDFPTYSRYEHSVGVMLLLRKLDADIKEQIAGLLHDVSHTAFSHTADWVFGTLEKGDFQDSMLKKFVYESEIPQILTRYNFNVDEILDHHNFTLLEQQAPSLCADRFDYSIREFNDWVDPESVQYLIGNLIVYNGMMVFSTQNAAEIFAKDYMRCQTEHWDGRDATVKIYLFAEILKLAISEGIITKQDLFTDDEVVLNKLYNCTNKTVLNALQRLKDGLKYKESYDDNAFMTRNKFRYIDPHFLNESNLVKVTDANKNYSKLIEKHKQINQKGFSFVLL